jgi:PadR family transcriptional regulator, regulatory protein PadR
LTYLKALGISVPVMSKRKELSFMNGVPELLILRLLASREMYGYELVGEIRRSTGAVIDVGEGCVYPILHAMEKKGLLNCRRLEKDGRSRLYYRLNDRGKARLAEVRSNWQRITRAVEGVLGAEHARALPA